MQHLEAHVASRAFHTSFLSPAHIISKCKVAVFLRANHKGCYYWKPNKVSSTTTVREITNILMLRKTIRRRFDYAVHRLCRYSTWIFTERNMYEDFDEERKVGIFVDKDLYTNISETYNCVFIRKLS